MARSSAPASRRSTQPSVQARSRSFTRTVAVSVRSVEDPGLLLRTPPRRTLSSDTNTPALSAVCASLLLVDVRKTMDPPRARSERVTVSTLSLVVGPAEPRFLNGFRTVTHAARHRSILDAKRPRAGACQAFPSAPADVAQAILDTFGIYGQAVVDKAGRVSCCETRWHPGATNGQYLGLFQIGSTMYGTIRFYSEARYGPGSFVWWDPWVSSSVARDSWLQRGRSWRAFTCGYA